MNTLNTGTYIFHVEFCIYYNEKKKHNEEFNEFITQFYKVKVHLKIIQTNGLYN